VAPASAPHPGIRLGRELARRNAELKLLSELWIVKSEAAAVAVMQSAPPGHLRPVLLDDGTHLAAENIARFIRVYQPATVRIVGDGLKFELPPLASRAGREALLTALATGAPASTDNVLPAAPKPPIDRKLTPFAVAVDPADPIAVAGAWLAHARGGPVVFVSVPKEYDQLSSGAARTISETITAAMDRASLRWSTLGDDVDAITLVAALPVKVRFEAGDAATPVGAGPFVSKPSENLALTDLLGRISAGGKPGADRWAYAGQISSTSLAEALYRVMCAVCLPTDGVFLFDGYESTKPWNDFSSAKAADALSRLSKTKPIARIKPDGSLSGWLNATGAGLNTSFIFVNTSGNADFFDLLPGRALAGDVPMLARPAFVSFVHSWSARSPENWWTISGRFFARGSFAYVGSVHEPFLQAFVPPQNFAARLASGWPLAVAARIDGAPAWRIAVLGDAAWAPAVPLPARTTIEQDHPLLKLSTTLEDVGSTAAAQKDFALAAWSFVMRGEDAKAAKLAAAALAEGKLAASPASDKAALALVTRLAAMAAFRAGLLVEMTELASAYAGAFSATGPTALNPDRSAEAEPIEALWMLAFAQYGVAGTSPTAGVMPERLLNVLVANPRSGQDELLLRDVRWISAMLAERKGVAAVRAMLQDRIDSAGKNDALRTQLQELLAKQR